jgi:cytochrome b6-f complex iron-sulfur subunit
MEHDQGKRRTLARLWTALVALAAGQAGWVTLSFLRPRQSAARAAELFVAGAIDRFEPGTVTAFPEGRFYLARLREGGLLALHRECTHLGCTVAWDPTHQRFACPCHASSFDITGTVIAAPAPRPLDAYPVRVENGLVKVDLGGRRPRQAFDPSQVVS